MSGHLIRASEANEVLFARYAIEWQEYHGISQQRRERQFYTLRNFAIRLGGEGTILDMTSSDLREWLDMKKGEGIAPSTLRLYINFFRPFFNWAHQVGLVDGDKLIDIRSVRPPKGTSGYAGTPRPYTARERERFWEAFDATYPWSRECDRARGAYWLGRYLEGRSRWVRARPYCRRLQAEAIVALAIYGGLRRVEIFTLTLDDMDPENEYVVVHGVNKGKAPDSNRDRAVPWISEQMRDAVEAWLRCRGILESHFGGFGHDRPWVGLGWNPYMTRAMPEAHFNRTVASCNAGDVREWQFHRMRHTAATEMLRAGMPIHTLSKILGHAHMEQTLVYTRLLTDDLVHEARLAQGRFDQAMKRKAA